MKKQPAYIVYFCKLNGLIRSVDLKRKFALLSWETFLQHYLDSLNPLDKSDVRFFFDRFKCNPQFYLRGFCTASFWLASDKDTLFDVILAFTALDVWSDKFLQNGKG